MDNEFSLKIALTSLIELIFFYREIYIRDNYFEIRSTYSSAHKYKNYAQCSHLTMRSVIFFV